MDAVLRIDLERGVLTLGIIKHLINTSGTIPLGGFVIQWQIMGNGRIWIGQLQVDRLILLMIGSR